MSPASCRTARTRGASFLSSFSAGSPRRRLRESIKDIVERIALNGFRIGIFHSLCRFFPFDVSWRSIMISSMPLYTRFGDAGETQLYGGETTSKTNPRIHAYG